MAVFTTLIEPAALLAHLQDSNWVVMDCRFRLDDHSAGAELFKSGHIEGAWHADLEKELSGPPALCGGRHPLPSPERFAQTLSAWSIDNGSQVIAYDDVGGAFAARLWWLLRWLGHLPVAVLDGGFKAWCEAGFSVDLEYRPRKIKTFYPAVDDSRWLIADDLVSDLEAGQIALIDARDPERFTGKTEPLDNKAGHVPGAVNLPFKGNLNEQGRFRDPAELRSRFQAAMRKPEYTVHMCGSGVTACHNILAMEHAGLHESILYAGSWSDWIENDARPIAAGNN